MAEIAVLLLQAFVTFAGAKNISDAAARLGITQPALSKQLRQLEAQLPEPVFTLAGRKKVLTPFGRDLYHRLQPRFTGLNELVQEAWSLHSTPAQAKLRVVGRRGVLDRIAPAVRFPGALHFLEASNEEVVSMLREGQAELGVAHRLPDTHELHAKPLFREVFHVVVPKGLVREKPSAKALRDLPALAYKERDELVGEARVVRSTASYPTLAAMVEAGVGWAVLPTYLPVSAKTNWILPAKGLPSRQFYLLYRAEYARLGWFKDLIVEVLNATRLQR